MDNKTLEISKHIPYIADQYISSRTSIRMRRKTIRYISLSHWNIIGIVVVIIIILSTAGIYE